MDTIRCCAALLCCWLGATACHARPTSSARSTRADATQATSHESAVTAKEPAPAPVIIERYCNHEPGPGHESLMVMRDASDTIGGYVYSSGIMDSPVAYLDPAGKQVAMFHIFGSDEEKAHNAPIIDALRTAYPKQAPLSCPKR